MAALTRVEALKVIADHEWHVQQDLKFVICPSCGARFRYTTQRRTHRPQCHWVKLTLLVGYALARLDPEMVEGDCVTCRQPEENSMHTPGDLRYHPFKAHQ